MLGYHFIFVPIHHLIETYIFVYFLSFWLACVQSPLPSKGRLYIGYILASFEHKPGLIKLTGRALYFLRSNDITKIYLNFT